MHSGLLMSPVAYMTWQRHYVFELFVHACVHTCIVLRTGVPVEAFSDQLAVKFSSSCLVITF